MNFNNIFTMQKKLDKAIESAHGVDTNKVIHKKILALIVEVGEFANEIKPFKYWKKDQRIDRDKVMEEFVDGIHFLVSIGNQINAKTEFEAKVLHQDQTMQLLEVYHAMAKMKDSLNEDTFHNAFELYMGIAKLVGMTADEIEEYYLEKNKINFERIANNY